MDNKKIKILASIFNGKLNTDRCLNKYKMLESNLKEKFDFETNAELLKERDNFQICLCNYYEALIKEDKCFDKISSLKDFIYKPVELNSLRDVKETYNYDNLFRAFRNKKEHPEKINCEERYNLFQSSIDMNLCIQLYECCDDVLKYEIEKLTENELIKILAFNPDIKANKEYGLINLMHFNDEIKEKNPDLYRVNCNLLNKLKCDDLEETTIDSLEKTCHIFDEYYSSDEYKEAFIKRYGLEMYEKMLSLINNDDSNITDLNNAYQDLISNLINAEKEISKNEIIQNALNNKETNLN